MTDETFLSAAFPSPLRPDLHTRGEGDGLSLSPIWGGILGEFRNHLQRMTAGAMQVRAQVPALDRLPISLAAELDCALSEVEAGIESLGVLAAWMNALNDPGEQVISDLHDVIERALEMAKPSLSRDVHISVGNDVGAVRNRRGAVECALAALIVSLAHSSRRAARENAPRELHIEAFSGRGLLAVEIESNGAAPTASMTASMTASTTASWRWLLAKRLAATVGGTLETLPGRVGVGLRFQ